MIHGGDVLVEMLVGYGVPVVFGVAGGQTLPLYDGIRTRAPQIRHIPMRDERSVAYAADGYARISGRVGVCDATVGPGAIKLTSGLAEAFNSSVPVVAIVSDMPSDWVAVRYRGGGNQLVDQMAVLSPLCKWTGRLPAAHKIPELVQRAFQMATTGRPGPVTIEMPMDLFRSAYDGPVPAVDPHLGCVPVYRVAPEPETARKALALLASAERPVMIVGGGVHLSGAREQLVQLVERLALPVATTLSGKGAIPESHPLALGVLGTLGGTTAAEKFVQEADVLFAVGFKFGQNSTFKWRIPKSPQRLIQLDIDGAEIGKTFPAEVAMIGDAAAGLSMMLAMEPAASATAPVVKQVATARAEWRTHLLAQATDAKPIKPQQVMKHLNDLAGPEAVLLCDASFASGWGGAYFEAGGNRRMLSPRGTAGLGWALPAAIGAAFARPKSKVIVLAGDGAMSYCVGELATLAQEHLNVTVVVLNNRALGWIKWDQALTWNARFQSTDLGEVDFAMASRAMGCAGTRVDEPGDVRAALAEVLASTAPTLIDLRTAVGETPVSEFANSEEARAHIEAAHPTRP